MEVGGKAIIDNKNLQDALVKKEAEIKELRDLLKRLDACQIYTQGAAPVHWKRSHNLEAQITYAAYNIIKENEND